MHRLKENIDQIGSVSAKPRIKTFEMVKRARGKYVEAEAVGKGMKRFDLKVGDIIKAKDFILDDKTKFEVTYISKWIFEGKRLDLGFVRGFQKIDYQRGVIKRV